MGWQKRPVQPSANAPMSTEILKQSYEDAPYDSRPIPMSHIDRLAVLGRLHGLTPAPIDKARVLEVGCSGGGNLLPMACDLKGSEFLGIDISPRQIADAQAAADDLGLCNIAFRTGDIMAPGDIGDFDYIVAHGVFSWVPPQVQDGLLRLCRDRLRPGGVAYISFNTYPGWHLREAVRGLMLHHAGRFADPATKATQARAILHALAGTYQAGDPAVSALLQRETQNIDALSDAFLLHDLMETENHPVYFRDFAARADAAGLHYLSEANVGASYGLNFPDDVQQILATARDRVDREQYIDFWLHRSFRETLLCRADAAPSAEPQAAALTDLWVESTLRPLPGPAVIPPEAELRFRNPEGARVGVAEAPHKTALLKLADEPLGTLPCADLLDGDGEDVATLLLELFGRNLVGLSTRAPAFVAEAGDRPTASPLVRMQIRDGQAVTNQRHRSVSIDDALTAEVLRHLDGAQDRAALLAMLERRRVTGLIGLASDQLPAALDSALGQLAANALLIA